MQPRTKSIALARLTPAEQAPILARIRDEIEWCDREGTRFDTMFGPDFLSKADFDLAWELPPLEELALDRVEWPSMRFSIRLLRGPDDVALTMFFKLSPPATPIIVEILDPSVAPKRVLSFITRDETLDLVSGTTMPGVSFSEFVERSDGGWDHYQYLLDEDLERDDAMRYNAYRITVAHLVGGMRIIEHLDGPSAA